MVELLSPAGNYECLVACVQAGANAVYLSGKSFGARSFAGNFDNEELIKAVEYCHMHKVKVYVTVNTIVLENEFDSLFEYLSFLNNINIDAVIVQDLGVVRFIKKNFPKILNTRLIVESLVASAEQIINSCSLAFNNISLILSCESK